MCNVRRGDIIVTYTDQKAVKTHNSQWKQTKHKNPLYLKVEKELKFDHAAKLMPHTLLLFS